MKLGCWGSSGCPLSFRRSPLLHNQEWSRSNAPAGDVERYKDDSRGLPILVPQALEFVRYILSTLVHLHLRAAVTVTHSVHRRLHEPDSPTVFGVNVHRCAFLYLLPIESRSFVCY